MSHEITDAMLNHPVSATVATVTATTGIANWFDLIGDALGLVAVCCTIAVSYIVFRKHQYELDRMKAEDSKEDKE